MTYDLRRRHLRGLIERIPRTCQFRVTEKRHRTALCFHRTSRRISKGAPEWLDFAQSGRLRKVLVLKHPV